jgi:hypothetical protein
MYNTGTFALPSTLWVAAFVFWSPSLVEKATRAYSLSPTHRIYRFSQMQDPRTSRPLRTDALRLMATD